MCQLPNELTLTTYLQPAILSVWSKQQKDLLVEASINKRALILGGDGRADSPGHSAKYGSYTVMELEMGVVIDVQLVQVCHFLLQSHPILRP